MVLSLLSVRQHRDHLCRPLNQEAQLVPLDPFHQEPQLGLDPRDQLVLSDPPVQSNPLVLAFRDYLEDHLRQLDQLVRLRRLDP